MNTRFGLMTVVTLLMCGCLKTAQETAVPVQPVEELFIAVPIGLPTDCGSAVRDAIGRYLETAPVETPINVFLADNQELLGSTTIPEGSKAYRRKQVRQDLAKFFERLDPEKTGGSQAVDLLSIPASVRKYRKRGDLNPRVVIIGSPLIEDREQGNSITKDTLPCDGCVTAPGSSYAKMATFPAGTTVTWLTARADYGNGPNHRGQIEHFLRYLLQHKQGPLLRLSSDAKIIFSDGTSQWDAEATPEDDCEGMKKVEEDAPKALLYDQDGKTQIIAFTPTLKARILPPEEKLLQGNTERVLFVIDISGSVILDVEGNDQSHIFKAMVDDACKKIESMGFQKFAVCGFGAWADLRPRLPQYPESVFSGIYWADSTPENRQRGIEFVRNLQAGGGTPTQAALETALELEGHLTCLLYTDGVPTIGEGGQTAVLETAKKLADAKVTVNTIGVGALSAKNEEFDWTGGEFLAELAQLTGGDYFVLDSQPATN